MYKSILIPVEPDHFEQSKKALQTAADLARHYGATITLMTLAPFSDGVRRIDPQKPLSDFHAFVKKQSEAMGVEMKAAFRVGDTVSEGVRDTAEDIGADLIVMSTHDPVISDFLLGSHAASVVLHATCSVLVVR